MNKVITKFRGMYYWLSNFSDYGFYYQDTYFKTNEHFYQYNKCLYNTDKNKILDMDNPRDVKLFSKTIQICDDWDDIKLDVMKTGLHEKFYQNNYIKFELTKLYDYQIIEGNDWHDYYWGICNGKGNNYLGKLIMELSSRLFHEYYM